MKKRILMISPVPSHPQTAGNQSRILNLGKTIKEHGSEFYFAHVERYRGDKDAMRNYWGKDYFFPISFKLRNPFTYRVKRKIRSIYNKDSYLIHDVDAWYDPNIESPIKDLYNQYRFDIVFVEYVFMSKALLLFPENVLKVIDTHDVLANRHKLYQQNNIKYNWFSTTISEERKGLSRADVVISIQDTECEIFKRYINKKVITIGHMVDTFPPRMGNDSSRKNIVFIGSANKSNIDAVEFFIHDIFPEVKREIPEAKLILCGKIGDALDIANGSIKNLGKVENLLSVYDLADVIINPIRMGTGLKIKNVEALGYGKPLVTTSIGAAGLEEGILNSFLVENEANAFAKAVINILNNKDIKDYLSKNGYSLALKWNDRQKQALKKIIN